MKKLLFITISILLSYSPVFSKEKPNIIYILADDMGYGDISCYGQEKYTTPHIDELAVQGIKFLNHYTGSTVCAPSRSTLMTGQHTGHTSVRGNKEFKPEGQNPLDASSVTVAEVMKTAGYTTGVFGKWGLGFIDSEGDPLNQGFDEFYGYNCQRIAHKYYPTHLWHNKEKIVLDGNGLQNTTIYAQDLIHDKAIEFIETNQDKPFFAYIPYIIPHAELLVPDDSIMDKFINKYPEPKPFVQPKGDYGSPNVNLAKYCSQAQPRATFAAMVTRLDVYVGQIMAKLVELGIDDNTIVMFASDNGPHAAGGADPEFFNSNGPYRGIKRDLYEGGIRTPFIVTWPNKIKANTQSSHISTFWDLLPTLADIAQVDAPDDIDGISFLPTLLGNDKKQENHKYLYWEFHEQGGSQAIRLDNWKAVKLKVMKKANAAIELYDLSEDIAEQNNVAEDHPEIVKEMEKLFEQSRVPNSDYPFIETRKK